MARRADPDEDIAAIQAVRRKVGKHIVLRADANRKWTYDAAVKFASSVKDCCLQYIEVQYKASLFDESIMLSNKALYDQIFGISTHLSINVVLFQEPIDNEDDIVRFCEETGVPVALDETVNSASGNPLEVLQKYSHPGVAAVVSGRHSVLQTYFRSVSNPLFLDFYHCFLDM